jgi:probable addiction module antidote protein
LKDGHIDRFLGGLRERVRQSKGFSDLARASRLNREALYKAISPTGNPRLDTLVSVLQATGLSLQVAARQERDDEHAALEMAAKYVWWKDPPKALADFTLFIAQLMTFATMRDTRWMLDTYRTSELRNALHNAPPGIFNGRSWHFWHHKLGMPDIPEMPARRMSA